MSSIRIEKYRKALSKRGMWVTFEDLPEVGAETTYGGGVILKLLRDKRVIKLANPYPYSQALIDTLKNVKPANAATLAKALTSASSARATSVSDPRVLNPFYLEKLFFGKYDLNKAFLMNLHEFLLTNPKYNGVKLNEILRLTLQSSK